MSESDNLLSSHGHFSSVRVPTSSTPTPTESTESSTGTGYVLPHTPQPSSVSNYNLVCVNYACQIVIETRGKYYKTIKILPGLKQMIHDSGGGSGNNNGSQSDDLDVNF